MKKIATYNGDKNGKHSFVVYEYKGKIIISNEHGTRPANKKEIEKYKNK